MKKFFLFAVALVGTMLAHAQLSDGVSATLQAGETTTVFYGYNAFKDAITAASEKTGNIITLSPGAFGNPGNISKSVKIYGAGFWEDTEKSISATTVAGDLNIVSTDDCNPVVRIEGVYVNGHLSISGNQTVKGTEIVKCSWNNYNNNVETDNTIIRQCYIRGNVDGKSKKATGFLLANSYLYRIQFFAEGSGVSVIHCILTGGEWQTFGPYYYYGNIIDPHTYYCAIDAGATCYYNVSNDARLSNGGNNAMLGNYNQDATWKSFKKLFADEQDNLTYLDADGNPRKWVLAEPTVYVDAEGTPCGVTGGDFPWNPIPATPRILSTSVDAKTTPGTLKVSIKAEARPIE